ncbi:glycosyltransferase [Mesorhizobium sp. KR9-304]|uniref:glycosyltransferase n=1 Tax=Mesorhizobium sp. KR9-304 TaxID=3156614 RepID=UPI0032B4BE79
MKAFIPFQTPVFVRQVEAGRYVIREVLDVATACEVHRSWIGREKAWRRAAETLSECLHGRGTSEAACAAFRAAAIEAGFYVERDAVAYWPRSTRVRPDDDAMSPIESEIAASGIVDPDWYVECNPDVRRAGIDPVFHFARYGYREGRQPNPSFTGRWYENATKIIEAPARELGASVRDVIERSQIVDRDWYLLHHPDVAAAGFDPVQHFAEYGMSENRQPNAFFSPSWYLANHPEVSDSGLDPALHYVQHGSHKGLDPHPLFDSRLYLLDRPYLAKGDALKHFLFSRRAGQAISMRFPAPPVPIERYPEATQWRIVTSPILTRLPAIHYLAPYLRPAGSPDDGPRSIDEFVEKSRSAPIQIGASLRQSDLNFVVETERRKRSLVAEYSARRQSELVSVIMPTRKKTDTIVDAINSLIVQTYRNWELIVIEDGPDSGIEVLLSAYYDDDRISVVRHDVPRGVAAARNTGLDHASGTAVVYLDDDDQYDPDFLLISLNAMRDSGKRMFYSAQMLWNGFDQLTMLGRRFLGVLYCDFERGLLERQNYLSMSVVIHNRDLVDICGRFDETLTRFVDWDFFLRMTEVEVPARLPLILHHYYQFRTPGSISATHSIETNIDRVRSKLKDRRARSGMEQVNLN